MKGALLLDVRKFMSQKHETVPSSLHCWSYCTPRGQPSLAGKSLLDRCQSGQTLVFVWVPRIGRSYLFFRRLFLPALTLATADCSAPLGAVCIHGKETEVSLLPHGATCGARAGLSFFRLLTTAT